MSDDRCELETAYCRYDAGQCAARRLPGTMAPCTAPGECTPPEACVAGTCRRPYCVQ